MEKPTQRNYVRLQWGRNFIVAEMWNAVLVPMSGLKLQWGRNFIVAEINFVLHALLLVYLLQWGRNFIVAEMVLREWRGMGYERASMGPQLYRCGNGLDLGSLVLD